jgi:hypothetical protein
MGRMDLGDSIAQDFITLEEISVGIAACQLHWLVTISRGDLEIDLSILETSGHDQFAECSDPRLNHLL